MEWNWREWLSVAADLAIIALVIIFLLGGRSADFPKTIGAVGVGLLACGAFLRFALRFTQ